MAKRSLESFVITGQVLCDNVVPDIVRSLRSELATIRLARQTGKVFKGVFLTKQQALNAVDRMIRHLGTEKKRVYFLPGPKGIGQMQTVTFTSVSCHDLAFGYRLAQEPDHHRGTNVYARSRHPMFPPS